MLYNGLVEFSPSDSQMENKFKALVLLNKMRKLGFNTRKKFIDTCVTYASIELTTVTYNKLAAFWEGREVTLIPEIENIVEFINKEKNAVNS